MRDKTFAERTEILEAFLADCANDPARVFMLTSNEAVDLLNLLSGLRYDLDICREANEDWADTAADLRDDLATAKTGLREFAKEAAFERQFVGVLQEALTMAQDERDELRGVNKTLRKELALANLRTVEVQFDDGVLTMRELDAAKADCFAAGCDDVDIASRWLRG
jgi:hypothetical protein